MADDPDFSIKANDRLPVIQSVLTSGGDVPTAVNLTGINSIKFIMRAADVDWQPIAGTPKVNSPATVVTPASGIVEYPWATGDTNLAGRYVGEWEVTWSNLKKQTFPTRSYHTIEILADLDSA